MGSVVDRGECRLYHFATVKKAKNPVAPKRKFDELMKLRDAALELQVSFPTIKQWIYKRKLRSIRTAGAHQLIPRRELVLVLFRPGGKKAPEGKKFFRPYSAQKQLEGRI